MDLRQHLCKLPAIELISEKIEAPQHQKIISELHLQDQEICPSAILLSSEPNHLHCMLQHLWMSVQTDSAMSLFRQKIDIKRKQDTDVKQVRLPSKHQELLEREQCC